MEKNKINAQTNSMKARDFSGTLKRLLKQMNVFKLALIAVIASVILSTFFQALGPKVLGNATNVISDGFLASVNGTGSIDFELLKQVLFGLIIVYASNSLFKYLSSYLMASVSQKTIYNLSKQIDYKINKLPLKYFDNTPFGDILSRVTNDVDTVAGALQEGIVMAINSVLSIVMIFVMMVSISPILTLIALITLPITLFLTSIIIKKSQKFFKGQQKFLGELNGHIEEVYSAHNVIKAFGMENHVTQSFDEINDKLYETNWKAQFVSGALMPMVNFIGNLGYVFVAVIGAWQVIIGNLRIGDIQAFIQYLRQFNQPINQMANIFLQIQASIAAAERIFEFIDEEEEKEEVITLTNIENIKGSVTLQNVKFGYNKDKILINDLNLSVNDGEKIAIVGPTGAGKTTLVNLLLRFYDATNGKILIDGKNINDMSRYDLRALFGMVLQDTWLFKGTVMDNIRYGKLNATDEEVVKASKFAHADTFIRQLPDGYNFMLHEDAQNISQGQRQLLTIARAVLSNPKILILDEATSSVDTRTELLIQNGMNNLMADRTSFVIAHRLSTIRDAHMILVMNNGDIVEKGNHQELLDKNGFYASLYNSQFTQGVEE